MLESCDIYATQMLFLNLLCWLNVSSGTVLRVPGEGSEYDLGTLDGRGYLRVFAGWSFAASCLLNV